MRQYHDLMELVLKTGVEKHDRTGTGTLSIFGHQSRYDLSAVCLPNYVQLLRRLIRRGRA